MNSSDSFPNFLWLRNYEFFAKLSLFINSYLLLCKYLHSFLCQKIVDSLLQNWWKYLLNLLLVTSFMNFTFGVIIHEFLLALRLNPPLACSLSRLSRPWPPLRLLRLDLISPTFPPFLPGPIEVDEGAFDELKLFFPNWLWIRIVVGNHSNIFNFFLRRTVVASR